MRMKDSNAPTAIDSVVAVEGSFKLTGTGDNIEVELTMVYLNGQTGRTYGSCPVKTSLLSPETMESLRAFLERAEEDFSRFVFEGASATPYGPQPGMGYGAAENISSRSLGDGLGEQGKRGRDGIS